MTAFQWFMEKMKLKTGVVSLLLTSLFALSVSAKDSSEHRVQYGFLDTAEKAFEVIPGQKYGLETEMTQMTMEKAIEIVTARLGGEVKKVNYKIYELTGTKIGRMEVKLEINETSLDPNVDWAKVYPDAAIEIVSDPILFEKGEVRLYHEVIQALEAAGAQGTFGADGKINPVSIQVNMGIDISDPQKAVDKAIAVSQNYLNPAHQEQIMEVLQIPDVRKPYLQPYSSGLMEKLFSGNYHPTPEQFHFDFFYRQSLEFELKNDSPWRMSEAEVRARIVALKYPVHVEVIKLNQIKVASLLLKLFPDDPYSKAVVQQGWIKAAPLLEFRNRNNDFNVMRAVKESTGIMVMTDRYQVYDNDTLVSEKTGFTREQIWEMRRAQGAPKSTYQRPARVIMSCSRVLKGAR